ncbi:hypothetical protein [Kocuria massiliensis]|uniref:hypothetical protein n=1 Tax=Kocuria massiliensis TaxID=1926282 RepID=UPI00117B7F88|nr:hypothetical protein [Kocuria massiliensis]
MGEKNGNVVGKVVFLIVAISGLILVITTLFGVPIKNAYNKNHYSEQACKVTHVEKVQTGTPKSGGSGSVNIESSDCEPIEMIKTVDGKSINDVAKQVKPGREYKFQFGDIQWLNNPKVAQKFEEMH